MNAQIYPFDPRCQTECEGNQKNFWEYWKDGREATECRRQPSHWPRWRPVWSCRKL